MTPTERKKIIKTINERVVQLLAPYGIAVQHTEGKGNNMAEFTFRVPDAAPDQSRARRYSELTMHLDFFILQQYHTSAECLDKLPLNWAQIIADYAPGLFDVAPLPTAAEIDWRPGEAIPEDYGAA